MLRADVTDPTDLQTEVQAALQDYGNQVSRQSSAGDDPLSMQGQLKGLKVAIHKTKSRQSIANTRH